MNAPDTVAIERPAIAGAQYLPLNLCEAGSFQPRKRFDPLKLAEMAASIEKFGVMQPILVRPKPGAKRGGPQFEIVAGERRWRGSKIVAEKRKEVDIAVIPSIVRDLTDFEARELATTENLQREDLHPIEEAEGYEGLLLRPVAGGEFKPPRTQGYSVDELAARIGKSRGYVFGRLKLLALIPAAREAFYADKIAASVALMVARMPAKVQETALPRLLEGWGGEPYSHRAASEFLHKNYMLALKGAVFDIADATLVAKAGSCHACPKRTGAAPDLFDDVKSADTCTDPSCFDSKAKAHGERALELARDKGQQVLTGAAAKKLMPYGENSLSNTGHVNLDKPAEELTGTRKNLRTLLGDDFKPTLVKTDDMEQPMAVATEADVKAALKAKGLLKPSTKGRPGQPAKALTPEDIRQQRSKRVAEMMGKRAPAHLWKHLQDTKHVGLGTPVLVRVLCELDQALYTGLDLDVLLDTIGLHKAGTGHLTLSEKEKLLGKQPLETLERILLLLVMAIHLENDNDETGLVAFAKSIKWPASVLVADIESEVDGAIADEIDQLKAVVKPAAKKKAAAKTTSTPTKSAAAQGKDSAALTPEKALAEAVAKDKAAATPAAKKTGQKDNTAKLPATKAAPSKGTAQAKEADQKDKAASPPPGAIVAAAAAWPFPTDKKPGKGAAA